jgi:hypothetical protein
MVLKRFLQSKKGSEEQGATPWHLLMVGVLFLAMGFILVLITDQYINAFLVYDKDIPLNNYAYRAINNCLAFRDSFTHRYYPGLIDINKYTQTNLNDCYTDTSQYSFNIQLKSFSTDYVYPKILVGFGSARTFYSYPVLIRETDGSIFKGELLFGMNIESEMKKETTS